MEFNQQIPLLLDISTPDRTGYTLPELDVPEVELTELVPESLLRETEPQLPELSEVEVVRYFTNLSRRNYGVDVRLLSIRFLHNEI